jgi:hypothetical protein
VGTPKHKLRAYEQKLLDGPWHKARAQVQVQLCPENDETCVLCRSAGRREKESAMRRRAEASAISDLHKLKKRIASGKLKDATLIHEQIGRLRERHASALTHLERNHQPPAAQTPATLNWKWNTQRV